MGAREAWGYAIMCGGHCDGIFPTLDEARTEAAARTIGLDVTWVRYADSEAEYMFVTKALAVVAKQGRTIGRNVALVWIEPVASPLSSDVAPLFPHA